MRRFRSFAELSALSAPISWAMGFFDGVHRGHVRVIEAAQREGALRGVLTFDQHPLSVLHPAVAPPLIVADSAVKERLLEACGCEVLLSLSFTKEIATLPAGQFLDYLCASAQCVHVAVGENWRFGSERGGDTAFLKEEGAKRGFSVSAVPLETSGGEIICSTAVRRYLAEGDFARAIEMLGHPLPLAGNVISGRRLARTWGFPTANTAVNIGVCPPFGVYAVRVRVRGKYFAGIANFGVRPTVDRAASAPLLEVHLYDFSGDLYSERLEAELLSLLRPEQRFPNLDALRNQIEQDIEIGRRFFLRNA